MMISGAGHEVAVRIFRNAQIYGAMMIVSLSMDCIQCLDRI